MLALIVKVELDGIGIEGLPIGELHLLAQLNLQGRIIDPLPGDGKRRNQLVPIQGILEEALEDVMAQHGDVRPPALNHAYLPSGLRYLSFRPGKHGQKNQDKKG